MKKWISAVVIGSAFLAHASTVSAQVLGSFRWQFAPYCNVVTLLVEQKGSIYELTGTEDGCDGAAPAATVNGSAHFNAGGTVGMSLAIVRPDGFVVNAAIQLNPASLSGTWRDNWANNGTFALNPVLPVAAPPRQLTMRGEWSLDSIGGVPLASFSFPQRLPSAPATSTAHVIPFGGVPTVNCPGSINDPQAAPGQLCLYERSRLNFTPILIYTGTTGDPGASADGFSIIAGTTSQNAAHAYGRWAVSVP